MNNCSKFHPWGPWWANMCWSLAAHKGWGNWAFEPTFWALKSDLLLSIFFKKLYFWITSWVNNKTLWPTKQLASQASNSNRFQGCLWRSCATFAGPKWPLWRAPRRSWSRSVAWWGWPDEFRHRWGWPVRKWEKEEVTLQEMGVLVANFILDLVTFLGLDKTKLEAFSKPGPWFRVKLHARSWFFLHLNYCSWKFVFFHLT